MGNQQDFIETERESGSTWNSGVEDRSCGSSGDESYGCGCCGMGGRGGRLRIGLLVVLAVVVVVLLVQGFSAAG
ncbi:MAG: hypothetical protein JXA58_07085 [Dehalococcoidia bacterium]|nr:hypothetical protein [Dehalococcoidia bacterium]